MAAGGGENVLDRAISPVADWTRLKATSVVPAPIASVSFSNGTVSTEMPRSACTSHGKRFEVNSISGTTTRAPAGSIAATGASRPDTVAPTAMSPGVTPVIRAKAARARPVDSSHGSQLVRPCCQSASAACSASHAGRGGSP
jgi:hypothetical protein